MDEKKEIVNSLGEIVESEATNKKKVALQFTNYTLRFPKYIEKYNITITNDLIENTLKYLGCRYFFILHDLDNKDYLHYHCVVILNKKKTQKSFLKYIVNSLCPFAEFGIINNLFECKVCYSLNGAVQYLTHKNYEDKEQYDISKVISNDYGLFNVYYNDVDNELNIEDLDNIILSSKGSYKFIIYKVGYKNFNKYYRVIDKLYKYYFGEKDLTFIHFEGDTNEDN